MTGILPEVGESKIQVSNQKEEVSSFPTWATVMEHKVARTTRVSFYIGVVREYRSPISFPGDKPYHLRNHRAQGAEVSEWSLEKNYERRVEL
jgi:hypothetical protein